MSVLSDIKELAARRLIEARDQDVMRQHRPHYCVDWRDNLLDGINSDLVKQDLDEGGGAELKGDLPKFCAAYSSSALAVNCFGPFRDRPDLLNVVGLTGFNDVRFEGQCKTGLVGTPPTLDVLCMAADHVVAIESKMTEFCSRKSAKFSDSYEPLAMLAEPQWKRIYELLKREPTHFKHLDAAQLLKHYFGLRESHKNRKATLVYLYWEPADAKMPDPFDKHRDEVQEFHQAVEGSTMRFLGMSYPELWKQWNNSEWPGMADHLKRLRQRYEFVVTKQVESRDS